MPDYAPRYEVYREVGSGATANVYLAYDTRHDRKVALKVLRAELTHAVGVERFLREIKLAAGLVHPNILSVFDSGETGDGVYYVMPYIEGETLRQRMERGALPREEIFRIISDVGSALEHAHKRGIVHRDIKPENIFLADGHAYVGDFGIAIAIAAAQTMPERLTGAGLVVGTPAYMSPEQAAGATDLDGRSDQYSLACVLYEMLTRRPPFGAGMGALRADRPAPRPARHDREWLSRELDGAVFRAISRNPGDRFPTVAEFMAVVAAEESGLQSRAAVKTSPWPARIAAGIVAVALLGGSALYATRPDPGALDKSTIAVFPFLHVDSLPELHSDDCRLFLSRAIEDRWNDVNVVNEMRLASAAAQFSVNPPTVPKIMRAARALRAGYAAYGTAQLIQDSVAFKAVLVDVASGDEINQKGFTVARADLGSGLFSQFRMLADSLMVDIAGVAAPPGPQETSSLRAMRAFVEGHRALWKWEVDSAAVAFQRAVDADTTFASANFWLAQAKEWTQEPTDSINWGAAAERAARYANRLPRSERSIAVALAAMSQGRFQQACDTLRSITRRDTRDFSALFALGDCIYRDRRVVRDATSPTGWRFRSSHAEASRSMSAALASAPQSYRAFRGRAFARLERFSFTEMNMGRPGIFVSGRDTLLFGSFPSIDHDSVVFWPGPWEDFRAGRAGTKPATHFAAVSRNREALRGVTREWVNAFPNDADALAGHAKSLERTADLVAATPGDAAALDVLRRARGRRPAPDVATELVYAEVRVLVKSGRYAEAARLGDSLVSAAITTSPASLDRVAGVAALLGRVDLAASLLRRRADTHEIRVNNNRIVTPPLGVAREALRLIAYAGAENVDSAAAITDRLEASMRGTIQLNELAAYRRAFYSDPSLHLFAARSGPQRQMADTLSPVWLATLQRAYLVGDVALMKSKVDSTLDAGTRLGVFNLDIRLPYHAAQLMLLIGDSTRAIALLDASLAALPRAAETVLQNTSDAISIPRTMALRAELAAAAGDRQTARRLASGVVALWAKADPSLRPRVDLMRRLQSTSP